MKYILLLITSYILINTSCTNTGSPKACFNFSKTNAKAGDTIYALNCSKNFQYRMWYVYSNGSFVYQTDTNHLTIGSVAAGPLIVSLKVLNKDGTSKDSIYKIIDVQP